LGRWGKEKKNTDVFDPHRQGVGREGNPALPKKGDGEKRKGTDSLARPLHDGNKKKRTLNFAFQGAKKRERERKNNSNLIYAKGGEKEEASKIHIWEKEKGQRWGVESISNYEREGEGRFLDPKGGVREKLSQVTSWGGEKKPGFQIL